MAASRRWWRSLVPFPSRKTLRRWFPDFETRKLAALIRQSGADGVIDIGANRGQYAGRLRAAGCGLPILSFEPLPDLHAGLCAGAARDPAWTIAPRMALGAGPGEVQLHRYADTSLSSVLTPAARFAARPAMALVETVATPVAALDDVLAGMPDAPERPFVKIDVQGFERAVLAGAVGTLRRAAGIQVELSFGHSYEGEAGYLEILSLLDEAGFRPVYMLHVVSRPKLVPETQMDAVLLRKS